jgi:quercetin dioxygenase-like cupin family protein
VKGGTRREDISLQRYVAGALKTDAHRIGRGGWILGVFFADDPKEAIRATDLLEVKYWSFERGGGQTHAPKISETLEWSLILSGKVKALLGGDELILSAGDYVLIHPGTPNNLVAAVLEDTVALTIKAPSNPRAKKSLSA